MTPEQTERLQRKRWEANAVLLRRKETPIIATALELLDSEVTYLGERETNELADSVRDAFDKSLQVEVPSREQAVAAIQNFLTKSKPPLFLFGQQFESTGIVLLRNVPSEHLACALLASQGEGLKLAAKDGLGISVITQEGCRDEPYFVRSLTKAVERKKVPGID